jgi:hypothetical protein
MAIFHASTARIGGRADRSSLDTGSASCGFGQGKGLDGRRCGTARREGRPVNQYASLASDSRQQARRAALAVHGLAHADRDWLLAQLPTGDRERLWGLLQELTALGIPGDRGLLEDLMSAAPLPALASASSGRASAMDSSPALVEAAQRVTLSGLDSVVIVKLLNSEPAGLIAHVPGRGRCLKNWNRSSASALKRFWAICDGKRGRTRPRLCTNP